MKYMLYVVRGQPEETDKRFGFFGQPQKNLYHPTGYIKHWDDKVPVPLPEVTVSHGTKGSELDELLKSAIMDSIGQRGKIPLKGISRGVEPSDLEISFVKE